MNLKKRTMDEMITHFNKVVSEMNISRKDKMTLLGMITAIGYEAQNAADVVPVRHGRWVKTVGENGVTSAYRCSGCGFEDNRYTLFNFCPNCGARMDKDGDGE